MTAPFMRAYTELLVQTCHRHGAFAMGGMAAFIPSRRDPEVNAVALAKVREDKTREARDGFDGSWVAHPDLVPVAQPIFDEAFGDAPNQLSRLRQDVHVEGSQLIDLSGIDGAVTSAGLRANVDVGVRYVAAWLSGNGAAAIHNLMEDAATAEISRSQIWQWSHGEVELADTGETRDGRRWSASVLDEMAFEDPHYADARRVFEQVALADDFAAFLTIPAYELID